MVRHRDPRHSCCPAICDLVYSSCGCAVYTKVVDSYGTMFFEVDDILKSPAPSCRFLIGREPIQSGDKPLYHVRTHPSLALLAPAHLAR